VSVSGGDLRARDAMVTEPLSLDGSATAQEAGEAMVRPEVRAVFVLDHGRLLGVITRKTLVREVVAAGRDPRTIQLHEIAEEPVAVIESDMLLTEAFGVLEERDLERVPVVDNGTLVGVLARGIVQRRLAEDEPPAETDGEA
jgi:CBS domain-containing protein